MVVCALLVITLVGGQALMSMREQQKSLLDTLNDQVDIIKSCDESLLPFDELVIEQCDAKRLSPSATGDAAPSAEAVSYTHLCARSSLNMPSKRESKRLRPRGDQGRPLRLPIK